jgi:hypothetical protein
MRVPVPHEDKVSAVLVPRPMAFLAVQLLLDDECVAGLPVCFFKCEAEGDKGDAIGEPVRSDAEGVARLPRLMPSGTYLAEVEGQETPVIVNTVNSLEDAAPVYLPIGSEAVGTVWEPADEDSEASDEPNEGGDSSAENDLPATA